MAQLIEHEFRHDQIPFQETGAHVAFVNLSGGIGVAYRPGQTPNDIAAIGAGVVGCCIARELCRFAVRVVVLEAGDDIEALMTLCEADITSGIDAKVQRYLANFELVRRKMKDLEERDRIRNFQPPITGEIIMQTYGIGPCRMIGEIKERIKNAILDGEIPNEYDAAHALMERLAAEQGLTPRPEADKGPGPTDDTNPKESGAGE